MATQKASQHSVWRIALARRIAPFFTASPEVKACFVFGSAALGISDEYSDLELGFVYAQQLPSAEMLETRARSLGASDWQVEPYGEAGQAWLEQFYMFGMKIEAAHWARGTINNVVASVVERYDVSQCGLLFEKQTVVSHIQNGVVLYGEDVVQDWRAQIQPYPEKLAIAMVKKHLKFRPFDGQEILTERLELPMLYENNCSFVRWILNILFGLNRLYHPGYKWTRYWTEMMEIKPSRLFERLETIFQSETSTGTKELRGLIEETLALVEEHLPQVELEQQRMTFTQLYPKWQLPDSFNA